MRNMFKTAETNQMNEWTNEHEVTETNDVTEHKQQRLVQQLTYK